MSFLFGFALFSVVLVAAPYFAHRLRRKRAETRPFAPARLVTAAPPRARRRSELEDHALFAMRALAVVALALLGASPFVTCARLSLARSSGASVALALVVDDSMSMQAKLGDKSRLSRATEGALQLLGSMRDGDAVAVVLAGAPARVALAPTTDIGAARALLEGLAESDRATDLDGALALAESLVGGLPQVDRRVVVLSDLADGNPEGPPLGAGSAVPVWNAMPEIRADGDDCGVLRADRAGLRIRVRVACTPAAGERVRPPRTVFVALGDSILAETALPDGPTNDVTLVLPKGRESTSEQPGTLVVRLSGADAVAADDAAPVVAEAATGSIAVVVPSDTEIAATGGAPVVEQAISALSLDVAVRPLPQIPDRLEDLRAFMGVLLDDPEGLTPEERHALATFVERGGALLLALGPRAAAPPLGATLEPFFTHPVRWEATTAPGADPRTATAWLEESAAGLRNLHAHRRTALDPADITQFSVLLRWSDGAPLLVQRPLGRGEVWAVTLPFALEASDFPLRPAFLALLEAWLQAGRSRTVPRRSDVGATWAFSGAHAVSVHGPHGEAVPVVQADGPEAPRVVPSRLGVHHIDVDGRAETRVVAPVFREVDLRPRRLDVAAAGHPFGDKNAAIDASPLLAFALLFLLTGELGLRVRASRKAADA